ncbi:MAG: permease [Cellvibrionales bacterium]|nr:MAG: permease [Cellvibrionales bacterium]
MQKNDYLKAVLFLNLAGLFWAGNLIAGSFLSGYVGPGFIVASRAVAGSIILIVFFRFSGQRDIFTGVKSWRLLILMSFSGVLGFQILLYLGLRYTTPINAGLMNSLTPLATALLAAIFLRENLQRSQWLAAAITIVGVGWILSGGQLSVLLALDFNIGDMLMLLAVLSWGIYGIVGRRVMLTMSALETTAIGLFLSVIPALLLATVEGFYFIKPEVNGLVVAILAFVCIGPTVLSLFWWNRGVQLIGPSQAALYLNVIPVYAIVLAVFLLDATLSRSDIIGAILVLAGSLYGGVSAVRGNRIRQSS